MEHKESHAKIYNDLADKIIADKTFKFPEGCFSESEKVYYSFLLKPENGEIVVQPDEMLYTTIAKKIDIPSNQSVDSGMKQDLELFLEICYCFRRSREPIRRLNDVERKLLKLAISANRESYEEVGDLLVLYKELYLEILGALVFNLDGLSLTSKTLFEISTAFWDNSPSKLSKAAVLQNLLKKIIDLTSRDPGLAEEYLALILKSTPYRTELVASVIAGILSADKPKTETLDLLLADEKHHEAIAIGLLGTSISNEKIASQLYIISEKIFDTNNDIKRFVAFLYQRIANNDSMADEELKGKCLQRIEQLCLSDDSELVVIGLTGLSNLSSHYSDLVYKIVRSLAHRYNESNIFSACLNVFYNHQSCEDFFKAVAEHVSNVGVGFNGGEIANIIPHLYKNQRNSLDSGLIGMLIDDRGLVRFAGVAILAQILNTFDSRFRFSIDLTQLPSLDQYKLWVSLLDDDARVLDFIPLILPLLHSKNGFVAESLMVRIEEEIKNYGSSVYSTLEDNIADDNPKKADLLSRVQKEMDIEFAKNDEKLKIKELDPRFTQSALLRKYYEIFQKRTSEQLEEQVDKSSIVRQLATTINLSKGGGYLDKVSGKVMELKKLAYEKQFPAKYFSDPENIDAERMNKILQLDWSKEFKECEAIISSYESTSKP